MPTSKSPKAAQPSYHDWFQTAKPPFSMLYLSLKALHVFAFVAWFSGLFYIVRLFIYDTEANEKPEAERKVLQAQFRIMQRRLWFGITWPAMVATFVFGSIMVVMQQVYLQPWFHLKALLLVGLVGYHLYCHKIFRALKQEQFLLSPQKLRWLNEVATLFLFSIAFTAVFKQLILSAWSLVPLAILALFLPLGILLYARKRRA